MLSLVNKQISYSTQPSKAIISESATLLSLMAQRRLVNSQ